jgi:hypothetical protein
MLISEVPPVIENENKKKKIKGKNIFTPKMNLLHWLSREFYIDGEGEDGREREKERMEIKKIKKIN